MKSFFSLCIVLFVSTELWAAPSAYRPPLISWQVMEAEARVKAGRYNGRAVIDQDHAVTEIKLDKIPQWKDYAEIEKTFRLIRDLRFIEETPDNLRRSTWLYPDDGCYARAALMSKNIEDLHQFEAPYKIFVFGNLTVHTKNALSGSVSWWFHVAPIVSDGKDVYVLDPAINPQKPLKLYAWLQKMGQPSDMTVSICEGGSYEPYSECKGATPDYSMALDEQKNFLDSERYRLEDLGRDSTKELGDFPPWVK